jgi:hypothetical protein
LTISKSPYAVDSWDPLQASVITSPAHDRLLVDAGPGTGKTAVACARLGHVIASEEVRASQTWMISFTRTAIAEIRTRLKGYIGEEAYGVKVATVDAHAWTIHSGYDAAATLTGTYDQNIERVLELVNGDEGVFDYLQNIEHLVVDEAQDLVGVRADLVEAIISRLSPECGVTVFSDAAQAIYGFSEDDEQVLEEPRVALTERLRANGSYRFRSASLETIHRTSSVGLRTIFSDVRAAVLGGRGTGAGLFSRIRESVSQLADGSDLKRTELDIGSLPAGSLVLFRTRSEALEASQFCNAPHSLRLSGYGSNLPPWIAICFYDSVEPFLGAAEFQARWTDRLKNAAPEFGPEEAWARLVRLGGASDGSLDMLRLRRVLAQRAPAELAVPEYGLPGPVIGTIHASKGREADDVILLMPATEEFDSDAAEEEEARVLFVGSTRARASLRVGDAAKYPGRSLDSGRCFRRLTRSGKSERAMFEFGRHHDIEPDGLVGAAHSQQADAEASQAFLTERANLVSQYKLVRGDAALDWNYRLVEAESGDVIGVTASRVKDDVWGVANIIAHSKGAVSAPSEVWRIKGLGSCTIVIDPDDAVVGRLHSPWSQSGFMLAPRLAAFALVYFWRKG